MIKATFDNILVYPVYESDSSLVILKDTLKQKGATYGLVIDVGPEYKYNVKIGDRILFVPNEGVKVNVGDEEYLSLKPDWVLGVLNAEQ